jgi:hypothetical protein
MEKIKQFFEWDDEYYEISEYNGILEAKTKIVVYLVVAPHSGTDNRWMLRVSTLSAFDRWANSTAVEEFFETDIEVCNYLDEHQLDIYKTLLAYLSKEYDEFDENCIKCR